MKRLPHARGSSYLASYKRQRRKRERSKQREALHQLRQVPEQDNPAEVELAPWDEWAVD